MLSWVVTFSTFIKHTQLDRARGRAGESTEKNSLFPKGQPIERKLFLPPLPTRSASEFIFAKSFEGRS